VDYILGSIHLAAERFKVLPVVPFSERGGITHCFIGATILLEPQVGRPNRGGKRQACPL